MKNSCIFVENIKTKDMKTIITALEKQLEKLLAIVEKRENRVNDASEKWQESETCDDFVCTTEEIEDKANDLLCLIDELKEIEL